MAKRLSLEERAEKKFPIPAGANSQEERSLLAMRKAWVKVERVKADKRAKARKNADREALKLGKSLLKDYPGIQVAELEKAISLLEELKQVSAYAYMGNDNRWYWHEGGGNKLYGLIRRCQQEGIPTIAKRSE